MDFPEKAPSSLPVGDMAVDEKEEEDKAAASSGIERPEAAQDRRVPSDSEPDEVVMRQSVKQKVER